MSLGQKVASGSILLLIRKIGGQLINLVVMVFLARLLSKEDFGILAISSVLLSLINSFTTSGIAEYVVFYKGEDQQQRVNAAFWLNLWLCIAVVITVIVLGPFWADWYGSDKIYPLLLILLIHFFFEMSTTVPRALLRKELAFKSIVAYSSIAMSIAAIGKVLGAYLGLGVYSLAIPQAIASPFLAYVFFWKTKWRPSFQKVGVEFYRPIFNYTRHLIGGRFLSKMVNEGDNLIVGKWVGLEGLGVYALAFQLANLVSSNVVATLGEALMPALSKIRQEPQRLKEAYLKMVRNLGYISFPLNTLLILFAEPIILVFYGERWLPAVLPLQLMSIFALVRTISSPTSNLFNALGKPHIIFWFLVVFSPLFLIAIYLGSFYGVIGVAISTTLMRLLSSFSMMTMAQRLINSNMLIVYKELKPHVFLFLGFLITLIVYTIFLGTMPVYMLLCVPLVLLLYLIVLRTVFYVQLTLFLDDVLQIIPNQNIEYWLNKSLWIKQN
jgi:O-antigen/teichoic acid export membrane protein